MKLPKEWITTLPAYKPAKLIAQQQAQTVKLSSNENPLGSSPRALEALASAMQTLYRYPDAAATALRQALADHANLPAEWVICANGSDELVFLLCVAFLREGDEAVMAHGSFISYLLRTTVVGGRPVRIPLRDYTHDLPTLAQAITPRTRLIFVCNPNNPTGTSNSAAEVQAFLQQVPDDVLVVIDEAYYEYVTPAGLSRFAARAAQWAQQYHSAAHVCQDLWTGWLAAGLWLCPPGYCELSG